MTATTWWWPLSRATGLVAWAALTASVAWGLLLRTSLLAGRRRPAALLAMHRWLAGLGAALTALHLGALWADSTVHFGPVELLVPFASAWRPGAVALGVAALHLLTAVLVTSLAMRRLPRRRWRQVHWSSYAAFVLATLHGVTAGSDAGRALVRLGLVAGVAAVAFLLTYRVLTRRSLGTPRRAGRLSSSATRPTSGPREAAAGGRRGGPGPRRAPAG
ncbi:MAG: ferric reductase-like transmembrane domain-containing protein [Acidimicrobiales bacterium]